MDELHLLGNVPLFHDLSPAEIEALQGKSVTKTYKSGDIVFHQGEFPEYLFVMATGTVDIVVPTQYDEIIVASFEAGSFFGELTVFDRQPRTATARATSDTDLICIPLDAVETLVENHGGTARQFISVICNRLRGADELLSRLQVKNVNELADEKMTFGERVADRVAKFGGSWTFIISFGVFLAAWMAVNTVYLLSSPPDPFPYIFLNLILSCLAALQAPVIMMSQNRQASKDRLQADQDYQVNIKAEFAIQQLHRKLDEMRAGLIQHRHEEAEHWRKTEASKMAE